ncbi:MAG: tRNA (adenosine(37)-N6)-threonylcarbamoyltransferase complex ATPase subunit type 1 TsaE [Candidatus Hydrogenedentes bacterium]|nr:tRNA (adenosine(37)-N6)-threonylcarbamoyltransferase complex ATPase subunit type 1 TsaE [Candidatus Hydrogenedentota bacterium]
MTDDSCVIETASPEETERLGRAIAEIMPPGVVALRGALASGKTCFVRGMAQHFGASPIVHSPTFTLINEYGADRTLYHFDLYRLSGPYEVEDIGATELFASDAVCAVEWAERAEALLPPERLDVLFEHLGNDLRKLTFINRNLLPGGWRSVVTR